MPKIFERISSLFYKGDLDPRFRTQYPHDLANGDSKSDHRETRLPDNYYELIKVNNTRVSAYTDYDEMDSDVVASALDIFSDDATQMNLADGVSFYVESKDKETKDILEKLFYETLDIQEHLWDITRMFAKYGDFFLRVYGEPGKGVEYLNYSIHPSKVSRIDSKGLTKCFVYNGEEYNPWDFVHFRLPGNHYTTQDAVNDQTVILSSEDDEEDIIYGVSSIGRARKVWKQLNAVENSLILSRMARAQKRNLFLVDVGTLSEPAAWDLVRKVKDVLKRNKSYNVNSGSMKSSMALNPDEDVVLPFSQEKGGIDIKEIGGETDVNGIVDVEYLNNKLFAALKVPKAFLGFEDSLNGRNTLRMLDVRYARTIKNLQRVLIGGLEKIAKIHLSFLGKNPLKVDFSIRLPYISTIEEVEKAEILQSKAAASSEVITAITSVDTDFEYVNKEVLIRLTLKRLEYSDIEIDEIMKDTKPKVSEEV